MHHMTWTVALEPFDSPDAARLRWDYYGEVAGRYWGRDATDQEIEDGLTDDGAERLAAPTGAFVVGRFDGRPASCAGLLLADAEPGIAELTRVFVRPGFRSTGGGGLLLAAIESAARDAGVRQIRLDTRNDLVEARGLYAKHGYREVPAFHHRNQYAEHWFAKEL